MTPYKPYDVEHEYLMEFVRQVCSEPTIAVHWESREPELRRTWESQAHDASWHTVRKLIQAACLPDASVEAPAEIEN